MMEPLTPLQEGSVCQTCGDQGFTNAFVYCVKCLEAVIHRYCLNVMPKTLNELVIWYCECCSRSYKEEAAHSKYVKAKKKQKEERDIASLLTGTKESNCQNNVTEHAHHIPKKICTNPKKIAARLSAKEKEDMIRNRKVRFEKECSLLARLLRERKLLDESQPSQPAVDCENNVQDNYYIYAQPVIDPVWRGSFSVVCYDEFVGIDAHLSSKACDKVFQETNMLPSLLDLEMHPKNDLWPMSFQESGPSDDKIALYFFPGGPVNEKAFDYLVLDLNKGLALRAITKNAELLIFTSIVLPPLLRRFQGKHYLWGVFRCKRSDPTFVQSHVVTAPNSSDQYPPSSDSSNEGTRMETLDARSPRSLLVQGKIYKQKLTTVASLIFEKAIKKAIFVGHEIFECFTRIGWGGVLDFEADEVYPEAVIEWMSTLESTGTTVESLKLTGQVNGKKATLDVKFIRETFGVDTGILGYPRAGYAYPTEETLAGNGETNVELREQWANAIFTTVSEGSLRRNLTPLAKVLWLICTQNIQPRIGDLRAVQRHEVPVIYGLATGNLAISYAHLVMMNIWRAYKHKEMTIIPHSYLISRFLKLKKVIPRNMLPQMIQQSGSFIAELNYASLVFDRKRERQHGTNTAEETREWNKLNEGYKVEEQRNQNVVPIEVLPIRQGQASPSETSSFSV